MHVYGVLDSWTTEDIEDYTVSSKCPVGAAVKCLLAIYTSIPISLRYSIIWLHKSKIRVTTSWTGVTVNVSMSKIRWEMCHLFVIWVFFFFLTARVFWFFSSRFQMSPADITLILCLSTLRFTLSVLIFSIFGPRCFFKSHFSCSLNFFKELLCSELRDVEMWSELKIFLRKGGCWMMNYWHAFSSFASIFWKLLKVCSWSPCFPPFSPSWSCRSPYKETHWWFKW